MTPPDKVGLIESVLVPQDRYLSFDVKYRNKVYLEKFHSVTLFLNLF